MNSLFYIYIYIYLLIHKDGCTMIGANEMHIQKFFCFAKLIMIFMLSKLKYNTSYFTMATKVDGGEIQLIYFLFQLIWLFYVCVENVMYIHGNVCLIDDKCHRCIAL